MTTAKRLLGLVGMLGALAITPVQAQTEVVLHSFSKPTGKQPHDAAIRDSAGNLYGTARRGGAYNLGVVYKLGKNGHYTVLHSFMGGADGASPEAPLILDSAGNLYGTAPMGGSANAGVVYEVDASGHETVLYTFTGGADGGLPTAGLIHDSAGNLYGTTVEGGASGAGVVFKLDTTGDETVLHSFNPNHGTQAGVIRDSAGNLYGTTSDGDTNTGAVYKLDTTGNFTVLYSFTDGADGGVPLAGVIRDSMGNLYGTTANGGASDAGVVYKVDTAGSETVLHSFTGGADGGAPAAGMIRDSAGNLYGTTTAGGAANAGVVFELDTTGSETVLYGFTGGADGNNPQGSVTRDSKGNLYGTTIFGGNKKAGVIFKIKP